MALTTPTAVPNSGNPATFNEDMDYFLGWLAQFVAELNAVGYPNLPQIFRINGSESAPVISWEGDRDTGIYHATDQVKFTTGGARRLLISNSSISADVPLTGAGVQFSALDSALGKVMKTGAFGLGTNGAPTLSNIDAHTNASGIYLATNSATAGALPPGFTHGAILVLSHASNQTTQIASRSNEYHTHIRKSVGNTGWLPWIRLDPQSGSNANGDYIRFEDGTQICYGVGIGQDAAIQSPSGVYYTENATTWTFPASFVARPSVSGSVTVNNRWMIIASTSSSASYRQCALSSQTGTPASSLMAIGRWK